MPRVSSTSAGKVTAPRATISSWCDGGQIHLYGWDAHSQTWHGPNEFGPSGSADKRLLRALRFAPSKSWYGPVNCPASGEAAARFFALVHDLSDCAVALIYCDESKAGPAEVLAVIPAERRARLRDEFAFEFLSFARFLGTLSAEAEFQVHSAITAALADSGSHTLVFSISSGLWPGDLDPVLSRCVETVAVTLRQWQAESGGLTDN